MKRDVIHMRKPTKGQKQAQRKDVLEQSLRVLLHVSSVLPLLLLVRSYLRGNLGFNPIEAATRQTGRIAVVFLLLSLASTPIHRVFRLPLIAKMRKPLGLYAALYAGLHFGIFAIWDYGLDPALIRAQFSQKPFLIIGGAALVILVVLAATSLGWIRRKLGKAWKWIQRGVYLAGLLVIAHYLLAIKGDLFSLQGGYTGALAAGGILILLLALRFPFIYKPLRRLMGRESTE
jgi:sulfoxide reductase heme-binding subunit YedZ